ncbi:LysR family transcriptional regulator [Acidocella aminolytica]|uniref:Transcriptional regulator LysR n=1 Tax=Acidocella aminolytica 101 = DSM 11237 TaxID=1120923 RepID=A0A0D6PCZ2_9PROT|nr:LysR family transcriptional regulator [Acidocella aminolytica]GAN79547.1 transcriptional regulator LysR [Acidocella aminolytica 101 = DSM 11237]
MARPFDLELLNTLIAVSEAGSISTAAPRLGRSQSAISEQIKKLEEMCGLSLFIRGKNGVKLTPAGERLAEHGRRLLALSDAAHRDLHGLQLEGDLRFAITDYFRPLALPRILRRIRDQFPRLRLHVSIRKSALIEHEDSTEDFDIGLSMTILDTEARRKEAARRIILRTEPLSWVAHKAFRLPNDGVLPLVVMPDSCSLHRFTVRRLDQSGVQYSVMHSASGIAGLQLALAAGLGVTCLNASAIPEDAEPYGGSTLPALPQVAFTLAPPRNGEADVVSGVRKLLIEQMR